MSQDKETVTGTIAQIKTWSKGNGYFLSMENDGNDYYAFGKCQVKEGDSATFEVSEGTGSFSDKIKIDKKLDKPTEKSLERKKEIDDFKSADKVYLSREEAEAVKQNSIERQCALKAAAGIIGELYPREEKLDTVKIVDYVQYLFDKFLDKIQGNEEHLPEPPEEP